MTDPLSTYPVHLFAPSVATWQDALPGHAAGILLPSSPSLSGQSATARREEEGRQARQGEDRGVQPTRTQRAPSWLWWSRVVFLFRLIARPAVLTVLSHPLADPEPVPPTAQITPTWRAWLASRLLRPRPSWPPGFHSLDGVRFDQNPMRRSRARQGSPSSPELPDPISRPTQ